MKKKLKNFHLNSQNPLLKRILQVSKLTILLVCLTGFTSAFGAASSPLTAEQQKTKQISGKVTDDSGQTVPGASVVVKGTTTGTITNMDGAFTLTIPVDSKSLVFSFVGMVSQEVAIAGKSSFNVVLAQETIGLEEVVALNLDDIRSAR